MARTWQVRSPDPDQVEALARDCQLDPVLAACMMNRNLSTAEDMTYFLQPWGYQPPDPFLIPDMAKAVDRITLAIQLGERICIYGDYDADGVTAIAILTQGIRALGGNVFYYIPDRFFEGVGLHSGRLRKLQQEEGVGLVITVDTGIRAFEEMDFAEEIGLDVIITDHHTPDEHSPKAFAVLNPKLPGSNYPFHGLCGAGVAFKVAQALDQRFPAKLDIARFIQIAAIGTIADMVPLQGENRWLVAEGLRSMRKEESGPLRSMLRKLGLRGSVTALDISYKVAPRINAPGRLGDPDTAIAFFDCDNNRELTRIVDIMDGMNTIRQMLERELEAKLEYQLRPSANGTMPPFVMVAGPHWHRGILGIMACKLLRRFNRPSCVLSFDAHSAHGSIRSLPGLNILEVLHQIAPLMTSYGGHPEAAGVTLSVTNISQFKARMNELLAHLVDNHTRETTFKIDAVIQWQDLSEKLFENLRRMAPFGIGNALPVFLSPNLILESELLRKGPWVHFEASDGATVRKCSFYHPSDLNFSFERFDSIDLVFSLTPFRNEYQVQILEMKPSQNA